MTKETADDETLATESKLITDKAAADENKQEKAKEPEKHKLRDHELQLQQWKAENEEQRQLMRQEISATRAEKKKEVPSHKKYLAIVKFYSPGDDIVSWLRNKK